MRNEVKRNGRTRHFFRYRRVIAWVLFAFIVLISHSSFPICAQSQSLTLVELNCENLFDCRHDSLKQDTEWLPASVRSWTPARYWRKQNSLAQALLSCVDEGLPDLVALVEVENDSCLFDLTRRSLLRRAGYQYLMTQSSDLRGIDVALLYQPAAFRPLCYDCLEVELLPGMRPTRDILYVKGMTASRDTLHVFVVHAPSRFGGERATRDYRLRVMERVCGHIRRLPADARVIVCGDFNDPADGPSLQHLSQQGLRPVTARGRYGHAGGTYRYQGLWQSIDHVLVSSTLVRAVRQAYINDVPFLLEEDSRYGGYKPFRTYHGMRYQRGFSDHLPLVVRLELSPK